MDGFLDATAAVLVDGWTVIGSFVAVSLLVARLVGTLVDRRHVDRRGVGPLGGAALGVLPGCGGAIAVVSLYGSGSVRFGTLLAALVATAGDSAFVLLSVTPRVAALTYGIAFLTALALGLAVNAYGLAFGRVERLGQAVEAATGGGRARAGPTSEDRAGAPGRLCVALVGGLWLAAAVGLAVGLYRMGGGNVPRLLPGLPVGVPTLAAVLGVVLSVVVWAGAGRSVDPGWGRLRTAAAEATVGTAPVVAGAVAALAGYRGLAATVDLGAVRGILAGPTGAVAGGLLGAVPGCGVHVGVVTGYVEGAVPLAALVANAISQDGDALFALLAVDRVAAVVATVYTVLPGIAVGGLVSAL